MGTIYDGRPKVIHKFIDGLECERCTKCDIWKPLSNFNKKKDMSDGLRNACRICQSADGKKYRHDNREKELARGLQNRIKFKSYNKEYQKRWAVENKDKKKTYIQNRKARINNLPNTLTHEQWEMIKEIFNYSCAYCGTTDELEQDHFVPLTKDKKYGTSIQNILPCCQFCNRSKCNKDFEEWYPMQDFYSDERKEFILNHLRTMGNKEV